ncbi:thiamine pyrophosphate-dependent enzyme [Salipaludibacillus neizhouensis]|uniref:thiamine pyrophosphate-dependent enzyme n=1 Tax=Salipaludibacillus neizhouensis TaxID=885475 RepID=UPI000DA63C5E|nr:thiamine pyrophosphate-dependent enzyme [Salipaludibacillus neizhouensis]
MPSSDLAKVAEAAGGTFARTIDEPNELKEVLQKAVQVVREGRSAVLDVRITGE